MLRIYAYISMICNPIYSIHPGVWIEGGPATPRYPTTEAPRGSSNYKSYLTDSERDGVFICYKGGSSRFKNPIRVLNEILYWRDGKWPCFSNMTNQTGLKNQRYSWCVYHVHTPPTRIKTGFAQTRFAEDLKTKHLQETRRGTMMRSARK